MALNVKVGSFALPTTNNATFAVTGVGFQPKVVLFWSIARTADAVNSGTGADPHIVQTILGMYDGTTSVCQTVGGGVAGFAFSRSTRITFLARAMVSVTPTNTAMAISGVTPSI